MTKEVIISKLVEVFYEVLGTNVILNENTTAKDIAGWDSLTHIDIILATEEKFDVRISSTQASKFKSVGELVDLIQTQTK